GFRLSLPTPALDRRHSPARGRDTKHCTTLLATRPHTAPSAAPARACHHHRAPLARLDHPRRITLYAKRRSSDDRNDRSITDPRGTQTPPAARAARAARRPGAISGIPSRMTAGAGAGLWPRPPRPAPTAAEAA